MTNFLESGFNDYEVRKLQKGETIKSFDCGDEDLNDFIMNRAEGYNKAMLSVTYVFEHKMSGEIIGYFSLANDRISIDFHGCGVGSMLLDFIKSYYKRGNNAGCRFLTVDAYLNAVSFYERNKFQYLQKDEKRTKLLYYDLNEIMSQ